MLFETKHIAMCDLIAIYMSEKLGNLSKWHLKLNLIFEAPSCTQNETLSIVQNICRIGQFKMGRE